MIPIAVTNYHVFQLTMVMIYAIALIGLNLAEKILRFDRRRGEVGLETGRAGATWTAALLFAVNVPLSAQPGDWSAYGADKANTKYSALAQIDRANVRQLRIAWRWKSPDFRIEVGHPNLRTWLFEATPVASNGILYTSTSMSQVAAIDGLTGKTLWVYDPKIYEKGVPPGAGFVHRGVALWPEGKQDRVLIATGDARLIALDAASGRPAPSFGDNGVVDLTQSLEGPFDRTRYHMTSPPLVCRGVIVVGSAITDYDGVKIAAPGDVRGYDARTGKLIWTFHSVPMPGEFGAETWERGTNKGRRGVSVWAPLSADEQLGYVYLPFSSASNDYYGGERPGLNLFGESLVCLNARTGTRVCTTSWCITASGTTICRRPPLWPTSPSAGSACRWWCRSPSKDSVLSSTGAQAIQFGLSRNVQCRHRQCQVKKALQRSHIRPDPSRLIAKGQPSMT